MHIVGEARNDSTDNVELVLVTATYLDAAGGILATGSTYTEHTILAPGQRSPFDLLDIDRPTLAEYRLIITSTPILDDPAQQLAIRGMGSWTDESGWHYYVGELTNSSNANVRWVRTVLTFYDRSSTVVNVASVAALADVLLPGQVAPFRAIVRAGPIEGTLLMVSTEAQRTAESPAILVASDPQQEVDGNGWLHIRGRVVNPESTTVSVVQAVVTLLDADENVINCDSASTLPSTLEPGQSAPFEVVFRDHSEGWVTYRVTPFGQALGLRPAGRGVPR
jgi:hypothetical protein